MEYILFFVIMMLVLSVINGGRRRNGSLLGIGIFIFILLIAGFALQFFLPILIILGVFRLFRSLFFNNRRNNYYYSNSNSNYNNQSNSNFKNRTYNFNNFKDFEEFFRQAHGGYHYSGQSQNFEDFFRNFNGQQGYKQNNQNYNNYGYSSFGNRQARAQYCEILGVDENASKEQIRKAYLKKANAHHPDKFVNASASEKQKHEEAMKKINEAYDNLSK